MDVGKAKCLGVVCVRSIIPDVIICVVGMGAGGPAVEIESKQPAKGLEN